MESKVLNEIISLGYKKDNLNEKSLCEIIEGGPKNVSFTEVIHYLTTEIRTLCNIDEMVNAISSSEDAQSFLMELSSFLKELGCPYSNLIHGHMSDRLASKEERLLLLDYLATELMAARILQLSKPDPKIELKLKESSQARNMRYILVALRIGKPPADVTIPTLFQKINPTVMKLVENAPTDLLGQPICNYKITPKQWETLAKVQKDLHAEYSIRREMLLKRLDCTIQSFQWSDRMKGKDEQINSKFVEKRKNLSIEPDVSLANLMCARQDLAIIEKTSSASVRKNTKTSINRVIIGQVPDRGGRTSEQAPPPPEMPSWQQRQPGPQGGGGRGGFGGRGGGRGGFQHQGGGGSGGGRGFGGGGDFRGGQAQAQNNFGGGQNNYGGYQNNYGGGQSNFGGRGGYSGGGRSNPADQYVQESMQNQMYQQQQGGQHQPQSYSSSNNNGYSSGRDNRGGSGRVSYGRGGSRQGY